MRSEEKSWGVFVIAVSVLVSVFVIALGCVRSCGRSAAEDTSSVSNGFAVLDSFPSRGSRAIDNRPYGDGTDAAAGSLPQSPAATAPSSEGAEDVEAEFREQIAAQVDHAPARKYIGRCRLTVYNSTESSWGYATATGAKSQHLMTCAVDPKA